MQYVPLGRAPRSQRGGRGFESLHLHHGNLIGDEAVGYVPYFMHRIVSFLEHYCLFQVADFVCRIELTAVKYEAFETTATDAIFFGGSSSFKKNYVKKIRKKRLE